MNRIEINVTTGEREVIELTQEEVTDAQARTAAHDVVAKAELEARALSDKYDAALESLDRDRLAEASKDPSASREIKDWAAAVTGV